jgi:phage/plasmid-associated DNA primase
VSGERVDWPNFKVTEEWVDECREALTDEQAARLCSLRGFPSVERLRMALPDLGWFDGLKSWLLPMRSIDEHVYAAKAWRPTGGKWVSIGWNHAKAVEKQGLPIGRLFSMDWVTEHLADEKNERLLWITAGEHDCLMLRSFGWLATTLTQGEMSKPSPELLLRELGGSTVTQHLLDVLSGIVVCFDVDDAGREGAVWVIDALERMIRDNSLPGMEIRAVDLRTIGGWSDEGQPDGWDISDLVRWSRTRKLKVSGDLLTAARQGVAGKDAAADLLGVTGVSSQPTLSSVMLGGVHTTELSDLIDMGVAWAKKDGSRRQGCYHLGVRASRTGWALEELIGDGLAEDKRADMLYKARVDMEIPKDDIIGLHDYTYEISRSFLNPGQVERLNTDVSNAKRLIHYYGFLKYNDEMDEWLLWTGKFWREDRTQITDHAMRIGDKIAEEAIALMARGEMGMAKSQSKWARESQQNSRVRAMISLAKDSPASRPRPEYGEGWNLDPLVIGTPEGVFDLVGGSLLDPVEGRNKWCSMTTRGRILLDGDGTRVWGDRWAACNAVWEQTLAQWQPDAAVRNLLQDMAGMALRGQLVEKLFILQGSGRSGKSTFLDTLSWAMHRYAYQISGDAFDKNKGGSYKMSSLAKSSGRRLIKIAEVGETLLDTDSLKMITGETELPTKLLYSNPTISRNMATWVMMTNQMPDLHGDQSEAMRGRLVIIPWNTTFVSAGLLGTDEYRSGVDDGLVLADDAGLKPMLRGAIAGYQAMPDVVLTWAYRGLSRVMGRSGGAHGSELAVPVVVSGHTDAVFAESDSIMMYFMESGLWANDGGHTWVATDGLGRSLHDWGIINDPEFAASIKDSPRVLGQMLRHRAARGFENRKVSGALWQREGVRQTNAWKVPFTYIGKSDAIR